MFHLEDLTVAYQCDVAELMHRKNWLLVGQERFVLSFMELADAQWCADTAIWAVLPVHTSVYGGLTHFLSWLFGSSGRRLQENVLGFCVLAWQWIHAFVSVHWGFHNISHIFFVLVDSVSLTFACLVLCGTCFAPVTVAIWTNFPRSRVRSSPRILRSILGSTCLSYPAVTVP